MGQFQNPEADGLTLLQEIVRTKDGLAPQAVEHWANSKDPAKRLLLLGWQGRTQPSKIKVLRAYAQDYHEGWLRALAVAGPQIFWAETRHLSLTHEAGLQTLAVTYGSSARPWLLQWFASSDSVQIKAMLSRTLARNYPETDDFLLSQCRDPFVTETVIQALVDNQRIAKVRPFLSDPIHRPTVLRGLCHQYDPAAIGELLRLLANSRLTRDDRQQVVGALKLQCRIDLGDNPKAWREWCRSGQHSLEQRLRLQSRRQISGFLLAGWHGLLQPSDFTDVPRVKTMLEDSTHVVCVDPAGNVVSANSPGFEPWPGQTPIWHDVLHHQAAIQSGDHLAVLDYPGGRLKSRWNALQERGPYQFSEQGKVVVGARHAWDARTGRLLSSWSGLDVYEVSQSQPCVILVDSEMRRYVKNCRTGRIQNLPNRLQSIWFSQDGSSLVQQSSSGWLVLDLEGAPKGPFCILGGRVTASQDGSYFVALDEQEVTLVDTHSGQQRTLKIDAPLVSCSFSPDNQHLCLIGGESLGYYRLPQLQREGKEAPLMGQWDRPRWENHHLISDSLDSTWVWELRPNVVTAPPEQQRLLTELWTGSRLQGGLVQPLSFQQYTARQQRWRELGGGEWSVQPKSL